MAEETLCLVVTFILNDSVKNTKYEYPIEYEITIPTVPNAIHDTIKKSMMQQSRTIFYSLPTINLTPQQTFETLSIQQIRYALEMEYLKLCLHKDDIPLKDIPDKFISLQKYNEIKNYTSALTTLDSLDPEERKTIYVYGIILPDGIKNKNKNVERIWYHDTDDNEYLSHAIPPRNVTILPYKISKIPGYETDVFINIPPLRIKLTYPFSDPLNKRVPMSAEYNITEYSILNNTYLTEIKDQIIIAYEEINKEIIELDAILPLMPFSSRNYEEVGKIMRTRENNMELINNKIQLKKNYEQIIKAINDNRFALRKELSTNLLTDNDLSIPFAKYDKAISFLHSTRLFYNLYIYINMIHQAAIMRNQAAIYINRGNHPEFYINLYVSISLYPLSNIVSNSNVVFLKISDISISDINYINKRNKTDRIHIADYYSSRESTFRKPDSGANKYLKYKTKYLKLKNNM
jgi:hypothetical protein